MEKKLQILLKNNLWQKIDRNIAFLENAIFCENCQKVPQTMISPLTYEFWKGLVVMAISTWVWGNVHRDKVHQFHEIYVPRYKVKECGYILNKAGRCIGQSESLFCICPAWYVMSKGPFTTKTNH
jgi:hypothetical protein